MPRRRYISTEISTDKRIAQLATQAGDFAALLYTWMIPHAADDCVITGDPDELLLMVVPGLRKRKRSDVEKALASMVELGLLIPEGEDYVFPPAAFYRYQTYISEKNRRSAENAEERRETPQKAASPSHTPSPSLSLSPSSVYSAPAPEDDEPLPFVREYTRHYRERVGKDPPMTHTAPARDLERRFGASKCIEVAGDYGWEKHPNYLKEVLEGNRNGRTKAPVRASSRSSGGRNDGPGTDEWERYATGQD